MLYARNHARRDFYGGFIQSTRSLSPPPLALEVRVVKLPSGRSVDHRILSVLVGVLKHAEAFGQ